MTSSGSQRYRCSNCKQTFSDSFDTIYYRRQVSSEEVRIVLHSHCEATSLRGISRISGVSYNTGVSLIRAASQKAQLVHNAQVQAVDTDAIAADEIWSVVEKNNGNACPKNSLPRTNGILRQQTGRCHRRQNKFAKVWEQTKITLRLVIGYSNWIWVHSRLDTTAAQRADLTSEPSPEEVTNSFNHFH